MKIRLIVSMLLIIMMVVFYSVAGAAGKFIVDDFSNAAPEGNSINSNGRTWISFGGLKITLSEKSIQARGNLSVWGGFFIEPGYRGVYGIPIPVNDKSKISIVCKGKVPKIKIELYDTKSNLQELWFAPQSTPSTLTIDLPDTIKKGGEITKLSFVMSPGNVDFTIMSITLE